MAHETNEKRGRFRGRLKKMFKQSAGDNATTSRNNVVGRTDRTGEMRDRGKRIIKTDCARFINNSKENRRVYRSWETKGYARYIKVRDENATTRGARSCFTAVAIPDDCAEPESSYEPHPHCKAECIISAEALFTHFLPF